MTIKQRRRGGPRKHRPRSTPRWLLQAEEIDRLGQERCLMVLSVLSGEKPVTDAIAEAKISRGLYYQLETRALQAMLRALGPLGSTDDTATSPVRQMALLQQKVGRLEQALRRSQRLMLMTRRVMKVPERRTVSTARGRSRSLRSKEKVKEARRPSTPAPIGVAAP